MTIYQDYGYGSSYDSITTGFGILAGAFIYLIVMLVIALAVSIVVCIALWKIFKKAGKPGWYALIPIFNLWKFLELSGLPGWLALIPIANGVGMIIACYKIAIKFGKSTGFAVCTIFFPMVCLPIIAFGKAVYGNVDNSMNMSDNNSVAMNNNSNIQSVQPMVSDNIQPVVNDVQGNSGMGTSTPVSESVDVVNTINNMDNQMVNNNMQYSVSNNPLQNPNTMVSSVNRQNIVTNNTNNVVSTEGVVDNSVKACPNCQSVNSNLAKFCAKCGHNL